MTSSAIQSESVDIVVPVFNEQDCIDAFYDRIERLGYADSLVFVDNASSDATVDRLLRHDGVRLVRHDRNEGYGASLRDGYLATSAELVVIIDVDLEYPPEAIPELLAALREHPVVYCSRFLGARPPEMALVRRIGNRTMSVLYNALFRQRTSDLYTGMKGFRRDALPFGGLRQNGFEHCAELAALIALEGHAIHEIPVEYTPRARGVSKMRHIPESAKLLFYLVAYWWRCVVRGRPLLEAEAAKR